MRAGRRCAAVLLVASCLLPAARLAGAEIVRQIVADPRLGLEWLPDRPAQEAWRGLFDPSPAWPERDVAGLALAHAGRLPTLWAARLLYQGEPWTRRPNESSSLRRWLSADRDIKLAILRDLRFRREPQFREVLEAFLTVEDGDPALVMSALADLWLLDRAAARTAARRIADPRAADRLRAAGLPAARSYALHLLLDDPAAAAEARLGLEWALLTAEGGETLAALGRLPRGAVPDLLAAGLARWAERLRQGSLDDDGTAAAVLACARLGEAVAEPAARDLATLAALAPRELACAAAATLARSVTWKNAIDAQPLIARLARENDPAVVNALAAVLLRLAPDRLAGESGAWAALARHRLALQDWAWRSYLTR